VLPLYGVWVIEVTPGAQSAATPRRLVEAWRGRRHSEMAQTARTKQVLRKQMGLLFVLACGVAIRRREKRKAAGESNRRIGRLWVRPWLEQRCDTFCQTLDAESWLGDPGGFRSHLQMTTEVFEELCRLVAPSVKRQDTNMRLSISVAQRVALTLQFLATGS